jgi:hypothetical protein
MLDWLLLADSRQCRYSNPSDNRRQVKSDLVHIGTKRKRDVRVHTLVLMLKSIPTSPQLSRSFCIE